MSVRFLALVAAVGAVALPAGADIFPECLGSAGASLCDERFDESQCSTDPSYGRTGVQSPSGAVNGYQECSPQGWYDHGVDAAVGPPVGWRITVVDGTAGCRVGVTAGGLPSQGVACPAGVLPNPGWGSLLP